MSEDKTVRAALIIIGNEILSGRTKDANLQHLAKELNSGGVILSEVRVIPDDETMIVEAVNTMRATYDYVFTTGGIGPTHADITAECVAKAFSVPLIRNTEGFLNHYPIKFACFIADLTTFLVSSVIFTRGNLTSSEDKFNKLAAYLTGLGLLSTNKDLCKGINLSLICFALANKLLLFFEVEAS